MKFSHLHVHTQFSLLDGAASIEKLYKKAIADKMPALAISDHGNMFGVFEFVKEAYNHKDSEGKPLVKPIVGCEFYITHDRTRKTFSKEEKDPRHHQILLAKNATGYQNLIKLTSLGFTEGMYSKYPRIDKQLIHQYHEGLIATTCCLGALVPQTILKKGEEEGENEFKWWLNIFQEDFYVELQRHGIPEQDKVNEVLMKFAKKYNVKVIASNDSHYVEQEDYNTHDILLCINTGEKQTTPSLSDFSDDDVTVRNKRFAFPNDQFFLKTTEQMLHTFSDLPEAIDNTNEIVDKVELLDLKREILLPFFEVPAQFKSQDEYLEHLTWSGAKIRYGILTPAIEERLNFELGIIRKMGFAGYFLIVSDFIKAGRDMGVFVGPGRGSAAGSAVAYCIGITNIDPIKYNLLFERFLNPERKSMPDIDTDFDDIGRQKVIDYVVDKYGKQQVAQIITYGTMAAKSSIADVARVLDIPIADSRMLTKLVPEKPGITLKDVLHTEIEYKEEKKGETTIHLSKSQLIPDDVENIKKLRAIYHANDEFSKVLREAEALEGSIRNTGVHASAIIIAPSNLTDLIPVATSKDSPLFVTQIDGDNIEAAGVIKMDFLGLKTLSVLKTALMLIKQNHDVDIDLDHIPLDDTKTFELYQQGETFGTFQFESPGMQKYLRELKPDKFDDLIAMNALYRPGPLSYIPDFINRKHGKQEVTYDLPEMKTYLDETYGITVYQEQVMLLSQLLADFSKGDADLLRKAMGKKNREQLDKLKSSFMEGATQKGHPKDKLEKIWTDWEAFAEYAFNKSHSTCYAFVAYQTAYLKAHYPGEFMAALLNHAGSKEKITSIMEECKRMGIPVLGPHINESYHGFSVNTAREIRFGLTGIAGVGTAAIDSIIEVRKKHGPFKNIYDLVKKVNLRSVNKKAMECLVYSGAFDAFPDMHRAMYLYQPPGEPSNLEKIIRYGQAYQSQSTQSANTLFGESNMPEIPAPKLTPCNPWELIEQLDYEKEVIGMYLTGHPLDHYIFEQRYFNITPLSAFNEMKSSNSVMSSYKKNIRLSGYVSDAATRVSRKGNQFGILTMEDYSGKVEFMLFGDDYVRFNKYLQKGLIVMIEGVFELKRFSKDVYEFKLIRIQLLSDAMATLPKQINLFVHPSDVSEDFISFLTQNVQKFNGNTKLSIELNDQLLQCRAKLETQHSQHFTMNEELAQYLQNNPKIQVMVDLN
ncbi:MAG TPA: DNA polymerase III subunit alpha [Ferruginibacter sp.]|nr:DNA polymerase III subunit alpha [Ferruginibacter sp.]HRO17212.1 DNA polymerase III subunit alpha [Ferruginibacter sp.]HRQ20394.1 DNA polymerase III subunit alpha [Ferruginibacter sp.]